MPREKRRKTAGLSCREAMAVSGERWRIAGEGQASWKQAKLFPPQMEVSALTECAAAGGFLNPNSSSSLSAIEPLRQVRWSRLREPLEQDVRIVVELDQLAMLWTDEFLRDQRVEEL